MIEMHDGSIGSARFGLTPPEAGRSITAIRTALLADLRVKGAGIIDAGPLASAADALSAMVRGRAVAKGRIQAKVARSHGEMLATGPRTRQIDRRTPLSLEVAAAIGAARAPGAAFPERLVQHWANHFTVSAVKGKVGWSVGPYVREAIRPNILGTFGTMLQATTLHPAMIFYLDNDVSVGPNSPVGRRKRSGLNENLGREILELHTLGAEGGYTQADVTALAAMLTGWTVDLRLDSPTIGKTIFDPRRHEPGAKTLLGRTFPDDGENQLPTALAMLAQHPATARNVSRRLISNFLTSPPPREVVTALEQDFITSNGDLRRLAATMLEIDTMWSSAPAKLRAPIEILHIAALFIGEVPPAAQIAKALIAMGQPYLQAPSPQGWSVEDEAWLTSDGIKSRLDWAAEFGRRYGEAFDVDAAISGGSEWLLSDETLTALRRAESKGQALALLLMSPEVQRR